MTRSTVLVLLAACAGDPDPGVVGDGPSVELTEGGEIPCASPSFRSLQGAYERRAIEVPNATVHWTWAAGITAADLDDDGWLDLLVPVEPGMEMYRGLPGSAFEPVGMQVFGTKFDLSYASGSSVVDYDGDGDLDIYVTRITGDPAPPEANGENRLLRNEGNLVFTDVTAQAGVQACGIHHRDPEYVGCFRSMVSSWGDYDLDGDLDLYVGNYGYVDHSNNNTQDQFVPAEPDFLYQNNGDGTFTDVSTTLPIEVHDGYTYAGGFFDLDGDADLDLYTVNDFGNQWPNRVMWNEGGTLRKHTPDISGLEQSMTGMGLGIGDLNGDALPDLAIPNWKSNDLFMSAAGIWVWTSDTGFEPDASRDQEIGWGTEMGDVDNDGDLDIVSQFGHLESSNDVWSNSTTQPDALYLNESVGGALRFVDVADDWGVNDPWQTRGAVVADLDRDGWLDIAKRSHTGDNGLYKSHCGDASWVKIALEQPGTMNVHAIGARVLVRAGGRTQVRWIHAGGTGFASSPPAIAHFGLGPAEQIDWIQVVWPDGETSGVLDVAARQELTITRVGE